MVGSQDSVTQSVKVEAFERVVYMEAEMVKPGAGTDLQRPPT